MNIGDHVSYFFYDERNQGRSGDGIIIYIIPDDVQYPVKVRDLNSEEEISLSWTEISPSDFPLYEDIII